QRRHLPRPRLHRPGAGAAGRARRAARLGAGGAGAAAAARAGAAHRLRSGDHPPGTPDALPGDRGEPAVMSQITPPDDDAPIDAVPGNLRRGGVLLAAVVLMVGGAISLSRHGAEPMPPRKEFVKMQDRYSRPGAIFRAVRRGEARPLIQVGLML